MRPRIIVTTDITSTRRGYAEPDDAQSLVRLLSMADSYDIEGLLASSRMRHGQDVKPEHIEEIVRVYAEVQPALRRHSRGYPNASALLRVIKGGQPVAMPDIPVEASVGETEDTPASDHIIRVLRKEDDRPIWICVWGGTADLAQALWRMRQSLPAADARQLRRKLRVYSIADQDSTGPWIRQQFPDVFYMLSQRCFRGMYRFGNGAVSDAIWIRENVNEGHGPLGAAYPNYDGGDCFAQLGSVRGVKEGDTPSFLHLFDNGLSQPEQPHLGGWGGRFGQTGKRQFTDLEENVEGDEVIRKAASVYRWRDAFQNEFAARMDWCVRDRRDASHPPVVRLAGAAKRKVKPGAAITLDLSQSRSADGGEVSVRWSVYPPSESLRLEFEDSSAARTRVQVSGSGAAWVLGEVRGDGDPPLTRYLRVLLRT